MLLYTLGDWWSVWVRSAKRTEEQTQKILSSFQRIL